MRIRVVFQRLAGLRPGKVLLVEGGTRIGPGHALDYGQAVRVFVIRLFRVKARNPAEPVLAAKEG